MIDAPVSVFIGCKIFTSCALLPQDESQNFSLIKINVRRFLEFCIARYLLNFQTHFDEANLNKVGEKRENVKSI